MNDQQPDKTALGFWAFAFSIGVLLFAIGLLNPSTAGVGDFTLEDLERRRPQVGLAAILVGVALASGSIVGVMRASRRPLTSRLVEQIIVVACVTVLLAGIVIGAVVTSEVFEVTAEESGLLGIGTADASLPRVLEVGATGVVTVSVTLVQRLDSVDVETVTSDAPILSSARIFTAPEDESVFVQTDRQVEVWTEMSATLRGQRFDIESHENERIQVSPEGKFLWSWQISPVSSTPSADPLILTLQRPRDGEGVPAIKLKEFHYTVSTTDNVEAWLSANRIPPTSDSSIRSEPVLIIGILMLIGFGLVGAWFWITRSGYRTD